MDTFNEYTQDEQKLAYRIAQALNDEDSIGLHLKFVRKYKEEFLLKKLMYILSIPDHKIDTSRAAYFNSLVSKYGNNPSSWN